MRGELRRRELSRIRQCNVKLALVLAVAIFVGGFAHFVRFEEDDGKMQEIYNASVAACKPFASG